MLNRRGIITGLISLATAPAIVRYSSLMPVKVMKSILPEGLAFIDNYFVSYDTNPLDILWCKNSYDEVGRVIKREWFDYKDVYIDNDGSVTVDKTRTNSRS